MVYVVRSAYQERVGPGDGSDDDSLLADADALAQNQKAGSVMIKKTNRWLGVLLNYIREEKASFSLLLRNIKQAPSSLDRLELSVHKFHSKHTDVRMSHLAVNKSPYFHQDRVEASIQQAILTEELRTTLMIVADAVKVQRQLAEFRAITTNDVTYDGLLD
ncbi:hypothetical protein LTR67_011324 [Exophiala xenobiotica]